MDHGERLSGTPERRPGISGDDRRIDPSGPQKPQSVIRCSVCLADTARICGVRLHDGQCTVTYRCTDCGRFEDRVLP
jgi:hypothetical protein